MFQLLRPVQGHLSALISRHYMDVIPLLYPPGSGLLPLCSSLSSVMTYKHLYVNRSFIWFLNYILSFSLFSSFNIWEHAPWHTQGSWRTPFGAGFLLPLCTFWGLDVGLSLWAGPSLAEPPRWDWLPNVSTQSNKLSSRNCLRLGLEFGSLGKCPSTVHKAHTDK